MLRILILLLLLNSNFCHAQHEYDSLVYNYLDSIWHAQSVQNDFVLSLDSSKIDLYRNAFPKDTLILRMKFGYVHDSSGIYFFEVISSDLPKVLSDLNNHKSSNSYPKQTFFKLSYVFDGSTLQCYRTHDMLSGFGEEYLLFLESIVDYSFKGFDLPFVIRDEIRCVIN